MKGFYKILLTTFLVTVPTVSHGQVIINEIMYDLSGTDTGREWVEVYNSGSSAVDLSTWKLFENNTNHSLNNISGGTSLAALGYAIIADNSTKFLEDWPSLSGPLFDSVFSLSNTGETLALKDGDLVVQNEVTYSSTTGANGDGSSLQRDSSGSWIAAAPTPGFVNSSSSSGSGTATSTDPDDSDATNQSNESSSNNSSTHYSAAWLSSAKPGEKFELGAGRDRVSTVGAPIEFKAETNFIAANNSYFQWSFGDGSVAYGPSVVHAYEYPGDYAVVLNVTLPPDRVAVSRLNVKIFDPSLSISLATPERIEVSNDSKSEVNLYGRALMHGSTLFLFPRDTIIKAGQKISFKSSLTGLAPQNASEVSLIVVGTEPKPYEITKRFEKEKQEKIALIEAEISALQETLARLPQAEPVTRPVAQITPPQTQKAEENLSETATVLNALPETTRSTGWLAAIKRFFVRAK